MWRHTAPYGGWQSHFCWMPIVRRLGILAFACLGEFCVCFLPRGRSPGGVGRGRLCYGVNSSWGEMSASPFLVRMLINMRNCAASPLIVGLHFFPGPVSTLTSTCVFAAMRCAGLLPRRMVSFFECGGGGVAPVLSPSLPAQSANTCKDLACGCTCHTYTHIYSSDYTRRIYLRTCISTCISFFVTTKLYLSTHSFFSLHPLCKFASCKLVL